MKISNPKDKIITPIAIVVIIAVMYIFKLPCPFVGLLHIQCAGCGMTRAYLSLLHFDIKQAFMFNPMFWSVPILYALYLFDSKIFNKNAILPTKFQFGYLLLLYFIL